MRVICALLGAALLPFPVSAGDGPSHPDTPTEKTVYVCTGGTGDGFSGDAINRNVTIVGGYQDGAGMSYDLWEHPDYDPWEKVDVHITVKSGSVIVCAFDRPLSSYARGDSYIYIKSGTVKKLYCGMIQTGVAEGAVYLTIANGKIGTSVAVLAILGLGVAIGKKKA